MHTNPCLPASRTTGTPAAGLFLVSPQAEPPVMIPARFRGPEAAGNGGYVCGLLAEAIAGLPHVLGAIEVTLRRPVPLERRLRLLQPSLDTAQLFDRAVAARTESDRGTLLAEARRARLTIDVPPAVTFTQACRASWRYLGLDAHPCPECYVCGPQRPAGDGLRLFAGPVGGGRRVAAPWIPELRLADAAGAVKRESVAAALDCPGAWASFAEHGVEPMVLGRLTLQTFATLAAGRRYVVMGWPLGADGRRRFAGTAIFDQDGRVLAVARATWIVAPTG